MQHYFIQWDNTVLLLLHWTRRSLNMITSRFRSLENTNKARGKYVLSPPEAEDCFLLGNDSGEKTGVDSPYISASA